MPAQNTDFYTEVGNPGTATTLASPGHTIAGTTFNVVSTSNWPTTTGAIFAVDNYTLQTVNGIPNTAVRTAGTYTEWEGLVASSTQITGAVLRYGTDQNYSAGSLTRVYIPVASSRENRLVQGLLVEHNQDGTHAAVTATSVTVATGKITTTAVSKLEDAGVPLSTYRTNYLFDFVASGGVWSGDSYGGSLNASMTAMVCYINGRRLSISAVTARAFTTNVDTYIDVLDNADGTGTLVYTTAATNAASPALAANSIRIGIIQAAATITAATKVNQGQLDKVLPIASSRPYTFTDSLGNIICPRDPSRKLLGFCSATNSQAAVTALVARTGCFAPVIVPTGRSVIITGYDAGEVSATGNSIWTLQATDGVAGTVLRLGTYLNAIANISGTGTVSAEQTPSTPSKTYSMSVNSNNSMTFSNTQIYVWGV